MNERIRELIKEARYDSRNEKHHLERVHNREITLDEYQEIYDKRFAELIVRECANICMEMYAKCAGLPGDGALAKDCAYWIKNDFGIE